MTTNEQLANASNLAVYSAVATYTVSFIAFALDLGALSRQVNATPAAVQLAGVGARAAEQTQARGTRATPHADIDADPAAAASLKQRRPIQGSAIALLLLSTLILTAGVVLRGLSVHRVPWGNMYEFAITGTMLVSWVYSILVFKPSLAAVPRGHNLRWLGTFITGPIVLTLGLAVTVLYTEAAQLVPALNEKFWLAVHVFVATLSSALFTVAFSVTVIQLIQQRREHSDHANRSFLDALPKSVALEAIAHRLNAAAFPLWTFTIIAGAIWAEKAWGRYWNWDPKETWSFVTFVVYAAYLHARATGGWNKRSAWLAMAGFACLLANFGIVNVFFKGLHSYAGIG